MVKFSEKVAEILKSLNGKDDGKKNDDDDINLDSDSQKSGENENGGQNGDAGQDGNAGQGGLIDGTELLASIKDELEAVNKSLAVIPDIGEAIVLLSDMVSKMANSPLPAKSLINKGGFGNERSATSQSTASVRPTREEFERVQEILCEAVKSGKITIQKSCRIESDIQKAMVLPNFSLRQEDYEFLAKALKA
jgi:hypothetical protein